MQPDLMLRRLAALAQPVRLALYRRLLRRGSTGLSASSLMAELGIGGTALSFHLKALLRAGLIDGVAAPEGLRYRAQPAALGEILDAIADECCVEAEIGCDAGGPARPRDSGDFPLTLPT